jgi:hypothetical protein
MIPLFMLQSPFSALISKLKENNYAACGIDAPFCIPSKYMPSSHQDLLISTAQLNKSGRPFAKASDFIDCIVRIKLDYLKPLRECESYWQDQGVSIRSTLWNGPRPGTPMTVACLTLLHAVGNPIWPWASKNGNGILVEAFPAAQLKIWGLPFTSYNDLVPQAISNRKTIVNYLSRRLDLKDHKGKMEHSADALDAVICSFAARAVKDGLLAVPYTVPAPIDGWISTHLPLRGTLCFASSFRTYSI